MNPALMALYLNQHGNIAGQDYSGGLFQPQQNDMSWMNEYEQSPVPGTRGMVEAPQLPKPKSFLEKTGYESLRDWHNEREAKREAKAAELDRQFYERTGRHAPPEAIAQAAEQVMAMEDEQLGQAPGQNYISQASMNPAVAAAQQMTPQEEYEQHGTMHGITPDPNSNYDMAPTSPAPLGSEGNPIQRGAQAAQQTARASYDIDEEQRRRALGVGMVKFFSNYAASNNPSRLGALNESFNPALDAFISERDKSLAHNYQQKKFEADQTKDKLDMELKMAEHKRKMAQEKFNGMSVYQQSRITGDFHKRYADLLENKRKEYKENVEHIRGTSDKAEAKRAKAREAVDKRWARAEQSLMKDMAKHGLDIADIVPQEETPPATNAVAPGAATVNPGSIPRLPNGKYDLSKLTIEQKRLLAQ